jgi:ABC-2 type transport system permease protein
VRFLISFFLRNGIRSRRTIWMAALALIPVGVGMLLWILRAPLAEEGISISSRFPQLSLVLFLHFLLPLMTVFVGSSIIADEVDERTLPYLLVRPIPKRTIILAKTAAVSITTTTILLGSLFLSYNVVVAEGGTAAWTSNLSVLLQTAGVLMLGTIAYIPLFGFLGGILKRPVLVGLLLVFVWERTVAFFPGNVKLLTVVHYLHVLIPPFQNSSGEDVRRAILDLMEPARPVSTTTAILILVAIGAVFMVATVLLPYIKEYRLEQGGD